MFISIRYEYSLLNSEVDQVYLYLSSMMTKLSKLMRFLYRCHFCSLWLAKWLSNDLVFPIFLKKVTIFKDFRYSNVQNPCKFASNRQKDIFFSLSFNKKTLFFQFSFPYIELVLSITVRYCCYFINHTVHFGIW